MTTLVAPASVSTQPARPRLLRNKTWDRLFVAGGAWLVPVPIVAFYLLRACGASIATAEDIVTLLVMVPLGGPHVFATYTRTYLDPGFRRRDRLMFLLGFVVAAVVAGAAVSSALFDVVLGGSPPMRYVLTFFFFWAGLHIVHQHSFLANGYATRGRESRWSLVDFAVLLLAMYPVSLFRMSMLDRSDASMRFADPDALATQLVVALTGSQEVADAYVFRIGRVAPILPEVMMHPALWIAVTVGFFVAVSLFVVRSLRARQAGTLQKHRFRLVAAMAVCGFAVPLLPNLDSAFQGLNAWHSFQYLGLAWLMNRRSEQRGEISNPWFDRTMQDGRHWRFYRAGLLATAGLLVTLLVVAGIITASSDGQFVMFGHDQPLRDADGRELYRPGAVLLAYYAIGMSVLLVHYLHDGFLFCRRRLLTDG